MGWAAKEGLEKLEGADDNGFSDPMVLMNDKIVVMVAE